MLRTLGCCSKSTCSINSTNSTEFVRNYTFIMGLVLFLYCFMGLFSEQNDNLIRLKTSEVLEYVQKRNFPVVDMVIFPPFVTGTKTDPKSPGVNYSVLSVMRFAPWIRRIHIFDKDHEESKDQFEYWKNHQKSRIVYFHQDLVEYSLSTPFLSEHFLVLKPHFLLTNYLFNWQMFIDDSPILRDCNLGILPLTRTILNECCYVKIAPQNYYGYAYKKARENKSLLYGNNLDHLVPPCFGGPITTTKYVAVFDEAKVRSYFEFEEPQKDRSSPYKIVLIVSCHASDDLIYVLPEKYKNTLQIWVNLTNLSNPRARLSFLHRMIVCKNVFIEILGSQFQWDCEKIGAEVMRKIRLMGNNETFEVLEVFSYGANGKLYESKANIIGNKLSKVYSAPFSILQLNEQEGKISPEMQRLKML